MSDTPAVRRLEEQVEKLETRHLEEGLDLRHVATTVVIAALAICSELKLLRDVTRSLSPGTGRW